MKNERSQNFRRNWIAIASVSFGSQAMYMLMYNYSMIFFTDFLGVSAGVAGIIFTLSRVWDAVNDPMCGIIIEKTNSRFGKTQPFVLGGGIVAGIALIALFYIPNLSVTGRTVWGTVSYNLVGMAFTAITIAMLMQMPRASKAPQERVSLSVAQAISSSIAGIVLAMAIPKGLAIFGSKDPAKGYLIMAALSAVVGLVFVAINAFLFKDQSEEHEKAENPKVLDMIKAVLHTPPFLVLVLSIIVAYIGAGMSVSSLVYYVTYALGNPNAMQVMLPVMYVATFISCLTAERISRFGKKRALQVAMALSAVGYILRIATGDSNIAITVIGYFITCVPYGYAAVFLTPLLMDCADYAEYKTGVKCQGLTMSGFTLCSKMSQGIGAALLGFALGKAGYDGMAATQTASAVSMISKVHLYPMMITMVLGALILCFYKLDEKTMEKVRMAKDEKQA